MCDKVYHFRKEKGSLFHQILAARDTVNGKFGSCGGRGACGKCRVRFLKDAPLPSFADRKFLTPQELREGYRLACTARPTMDCDVEICFIQEKKAEIVTISEAGKGTSETIEKGRGKLPQSEPRAPGHLFCSVDIGTTTVAMQLVEKETGRILYTCAFQNPQRVYGVDVLARITAAQEGKGSLLRELLLRELEKGLKELETVGRPEQVVLAGNTTMGHLLLGYPVESLGKAPFTPYHIGSSAFRLLDIPALFLPGVSAFIGADIVAGIYACGMAEREELSLFIDLGTNGEMAVGNRDGLLCTATAAGSAFEGDVSSQVIGTDMVSLADEMLKNGIMDETGLMDEPWFTEGYGTKGIRIRQQDIRSLQMAKAAVCAGAGILLERMGAWNKIDRVYLAGGFGYYLDVDKAADIGLIPDVLRGRCRAMGNTSLAGARRYGMREEKEKLERIIQISQSLNLARQPEFEACYIDAMAFRRICPQ